MTYAVLGFYMIVQAWGGFNCSINDLDPNSLRLILLAEVQPDRDRNIVKFKFAFQWCEGQGDPWWLSESGKADVVDFDEDAPSSKVCEEHLLREQRCVPPTQL